jgi:hypothetical protein
MSRLLPEVIGYRILICGVRISRVSGESGRVPL